MQKYKTIIGVLKMTAEKKPYSTIQAQYFIGSSTVTRIRSRFKALGKPLEELEAMDPGEVERLFYPPVQHTRTDQLPDYEAIHKEICGSDYRVIAQCWEDYHAEHPLGYQMSQFYQNYRDFLKAKYGVQELKMLVERIPGERMYIDWVGDKSALIFDPDTGKNRNIHLFVTTMAFSSYAYVEAFPDETSASFNSGMTHALSFYQGVPRFFVPDNLKTAVKKHTKDQLELNASFAALEEYYGAVTLPPPPRKPKGKSSVENEVKDAENRLLGWLKKDRKKRPFTSFEQLNERIAELVEKINTTPFKDTKDIRGSRKEAFWKFDHPQLRDLPDRLFTPVDYKGVDAIPPTYHIEYDNHFYSVSYKYVGKPALLKATPSQIIICDENNRLLRTHRRVYSDFPRNVTEDEDRPPHHLYYAKVNQFDMAWYRQRAAEYGAEMSDLISRIIASYDHEEQASESCMSILSRCQNIPLSVVRSAARAALQDEKRHYHTAFKKAAKTAMEAYRSPDSSDTDSSDENSGASDNGKFRFPDDDSNSRGRNHYQ